MWRRPQLADSSGAFTIAAALDGQRTDGLRTLQHGTEVDERWFADQTLANRTALSARFHEVIDDSVKPAVVTAKSSHSTANTSVHSSLTNRQHMTAHDKRQQPAHARMGQQGAAQGLSAEGVPSALLRLGAQSRVHNWSRRPEFDAVPELLPEIVQSPPCEEPQIADIIERAAGAHSFGHSVAALALYESARDMWSAQQREQPEGATEQRLAQAVANDEEPPASAAEVSIFFQTVVGQVQLGIAAAGSTDGAEAEKRCDAALCAFLDAQQQSFLLPDGHPAIALGFSCVSAAQYQVGDLPAAAEAAEACVTMRTAQLGGAHPLTATALNNSGVVAVAQGRGRDARVLFAKAFEVNRATLGPSHPHTFACLRNKGKANKMPLNIKTLRSRHRAGITRVVTVPPKKKAAAKGKKGDKKGGKKKGGKKK